MKILDKDGKEIPPEIYIESLKMVLDDLRKERDDEIIEKLKSAMKELDEKRI